ncbi:MAG TPA: heme-binding domain-containing protein [Lacunisphaera sp.]|nr:heme-binding domain-containing protein [Lacunisphaera sp.]
MKRLLPRLAAGLGVALLLAQLWRPPRNESPAGGPADIAAKHPVPPAVLDLLHRACYDCHSNHTRYPWYANVQPVRWWLDHHINEGKQHLNFSEFGAYADQRAAKKLDELIDEVEGHTMPLPSYTWIHRDARLSPADVKLLTAWADGLRAEIAP